MSFHDGLGDGQTEASATGGSAARFVSTIEALKDVGQVFGFNPGAVVGNTQNGGPVFLVGHDVDLAPRLVVKNGVR